MSRYSLLTELAHVKKDKVIMACACGGGKGLPHILTLKPKILVVVDNDIDTMYRAMRICETQPLIKYERILFSCADIRKLHFENYFDYFYCCETLEHLTEKNNNQVASSILQTIKPGGRLLLSVPGHKHSMKNPKHKQVLSDKTIFAMFGSQCTFIDRGIYHKYLNDSTKAQYFTNLFVFEKQSRK